MREVTLATLRALVRQRADIEYDEGRHSDAMLDAEINEAIRALRGKLTNDGFRLWTAPYYGTMVTTAVPNANYGLLDLPDAADSIEMIAIVDSGEVSRLERINLEESAVYDVGSTGKPEAWFPLPIDVGAMAVLPAPDYAYRYVIHYTTQFEDLEEDEDTLFALNGFVDFIVWTVAHVIAVRDDLKSLKEDSERQAALAYQVSSSSAASMNRTERKRRNTREQEEQRASTRIRGDWP